MVPEYTYGSRKQGKEKVLTSLTTMSSDPLADVLLKHTMLALVMQKFWFQRENIGTRMHINYSTESKATNATQ